MARSQIALTCANCGTKFVHVHFSLNRNEANDYERWAADNVTRCPACFSKIKQHEESNALAAELDKRNLVLPEISGDSDRQIAYAARLRQNVLIRKMRALDNYVTIMDKITADPDGFAKLCESEGHTHDDGIRAVMEAYGLYDVMLMLTTKNASEIIDASKH